MLKTSLITLIVLFKNLICPCHQDKVHSGFKVNSGHYKIHKTGKLPLEINESSGITIAKNDSSYWTHNDNGGNVKLYEINFQGKLLSTWLIDKTGGRDLEEITKDEEGNIYLGDFGNNANNRKDLRIFKVNINEGNRIDTISFSYPDQMQFPPEKENRNFDCEAFFSYKNHLYLFSKNRGNKIIHIYKLPQQPGKYQAEKVQEIYINAMVTGASLCPDKKGFALLSYGKLYFFNFSDDGKNFASPIFCKRFSRSGQAEGITYINETDLLISNEGRKLFRVEKRK